MGVSGKVVIKMIDDLSGQGRTIYLDNWYSSPALFSRLHKQKNNVIGTVRLNRKYLPTVTKKSLKKIGKGEVATVSSDTMAFMLWRDKKVASMLSTSETDELVDTGKVDKKTGEPQFKPKCVIEYNDNMGGVDRCDQIIAPYEITRKTPRWYQKIASNLVDMVIFNLHVIYNSFREIKVTHYDFRMMLIRESIEKYGKKPKENDDRPSDDHRPTKIPSGEGSQKRSRCIPCKKKGNTRDTVWCCADCKDIPICKNCFEIYHENIDEDAPFF